MSQPTTLYQHQPHAHTPQNVNERHAAERAASAARPGWRGHLSAFNERLAVWLTQHTGTMTCAYVFFGIGMGSLVGVFTGNVFLASLFGSVSSYVLQLVLLPVLSVGQNVLARHAELQADEQFHATQRTLHESQQMMRHLDAQDAELLRQTCLLESLLSATQSPAPAAVPAVPSTPAKPKRARASTPRRS